MRILLICTILFLPACTQFPELDARLPDDTRDASYPTLLPVDEILAGRRLPAKRGTELTETIEARVSALKTRANRLRRSVLSPTDRARLQQRPGA